MRTNVVIIMFFASFLLVTEVYAGTTGKLSGIVIDTETKEPLAGANIFIEGTALGASTDLDGYYFIINVPPGKHIVNYGFMGYADKKIEIRTSVDVTSHLNVELSSTIFESQEVVVVADRPMIQRDLTSTSAKISGEEIALLPIESIAEIVNLQAGVVEGHFRGGRLGEVSYMIDGIAVNDAYNGSQMIDLQPNSVEEVEVISGTFNAEYGQAMSGVVNIISKEPGNELNGEVSGYIGGNFSSRKTPFAIKSGEGTKRDQYSDEELSFYDIADIPDSYDLQGSLSGSILSDNILFFTSLRNKRDGGYLYGERIFMPSDSSYLSSKREDWQIEATGDGEYVPLNWHEGLSVHGKLIFKPFTSHKISYEFIHENEESQNYSHGYKYNPDGLPTNYSQSFTHMLHYDYVINPRGFINTKFAILKKEYERYLYEDPYDLRYQPITRFNIGSGQNFYMAGTDMGHSFRSSKASIIKSDFTYQIDRFNQIKMGIEGKFHEIYVHDFVIEVSRLTDWKPRPIDKSSPNYTEFTKKPFEFSAYFQDRIEWSYSIINMGVRYDYFQPYGEYPSDLMRPDTSARLKASIKSQVSPRFGVALPISEKSVMHLSYGLFFQMPSFDQLYTNPDFNIPLGSFVTIGNSDLEPQRTSTYEIGIQHEIESNMAVDATVFYKDIRNLLGMEVYTVLPSFDKYARYVNRDYGQVFGFTLAYEQRSEFLRTTVDYTYMSAEGNSSDPRDVYLKSLTTPPTEITKQLIYLDWDRTHSLNLTATIHNKDFWSLGLIGQFGSGFPYTPEQEGYYPSRENNERKPYYLNFDLNFTLSFKFGGIKSTLFSKIYNLFDIENEIAVYKDTGRATYSLEEQYLTDDLVKGINTIHDYYYRPNYLSAPRRIHAGVKFNF
jgi:outer membrane receptor protein involved in Fe transport